MRIKTVLSVLALWIAPALASAQTFTDHGGTVSLQTIEGQTQFVIDAAVVDTPPGTLSLRCPLTGGAPVYPYYQVWSCAGGSYSLRSTDGLTVLDGAISGPLTVLKYGGGRLSPLWYSTKLTAGLVGILNDAPVTGTTVQVSTTRKPMPLVTGTVGKGTTTLP